MFEHLKRTIAEHHLRLQVIADKKRGFEEERIRRRRQQNDERWRELNIRMDELIERFR